MQARSECDKENRFLESKGLSVKLSQVETVYSRAIESLKPKNIPEEVNHRSLEKTKISNFLRNFLLDEGRGLNTLIITGRPGAGKSLLVNNILIALESKQYSFFGSDGSKPAEGSPGAKGKRIEVLQFNAMAYSMCFPLLLEIISQIFERAGIDFSKTAIKNGTYLLELFKNRLDKLLQDHIYIIMIDELDTLAKHDQKNFEMINDLLNIQDKGLVKIGISNTLDLFAKYKNTKKYVESRQMAFKPYENEDLWAILKERLMTAMKSGPIGLETIADQGVMTNICKKIHKNAFGDIRLMLAIVKDIFERKLSKIKKNAKKKAEAQGVPESDMEVSLSELKISILEGISVVDEKYADMQGNILTSLSLPIQTCLLAVYFCLQDKQTFVTFDAFKAKLDECLENLAIPRAHLDIEQNLMMLEVYKFIERPSKPPKGLLQVKPTKSGVKQPAVIESKFKKEDLKQYLLEIEAFSNFFEDAQSANHCN